jgi:hypothetical protein
MFFAFLALAGCHGWAQGATDAQLDANVQKQNKSLADQDPKIRYDTASELGGDGPLEKAAVSALEAAIANDTDATVR